jgi:hypothetical protein
MTVLARKELTFSAKDYEEADKYAKVLLRNRFEQDSVVLTSVEKANVQNRPSRIQPSQSDDGD